MGTVVEPGRNIRQKAGLNRGILNAGWHLFATLLTYKMEVRGGQVVAVPARFTSQTCAACGVVDARSRESQARFTCIGCGHTDHADINAAINIKRRWSTPLLDVEGVHQQPCEASTGRDLAISEKSPSFTAGKMLTRVSEQVSRARSTVAVLRAEYGRPHRPLATACMALRHPARRSGTHAAAVRGENEWIA